MNLLHAKSNSKWTSLISLVLSLHLICCYRDRKCLLLFSLPVAWNSFHMDTLTDPISRSRMHSERDCLRNAQ